MKAMMAVGSHRLDGAMCTGPNWNPLEWVSNSVPMDIATAREEASFFASEPGQAITYQVGKLQILGFLADARRVQGDAFTLRGFHDTLWENGNVPIALLRWEALGATDQVRLLDTASNRLTT